MDKHKISTTRIFLACLSLLITASYGHADDTEIFFAPASASSTNPNIMFAIDTSGSMAWVPAANNVMPENGEQSRMDIVKEVFDDVIVQLNNVNAGLMRFNAESPQFGRSYYGGPVLYPISNLSTPISPVVIREIQSGADDGVEHSNGTVDLTSQNLQVGGKPAEFTVLRFVNLGVPQGARITSAKIAFNANKTEALGSRVTLFGEKVDDAAPLVESLNSLSRRAQTSTVKSVAWKLDGWTKDDSYTTPDLSQIIQEIVNSPGWCGGNDLVIFIKKTGANSRFAYSADAVVSAGGNENSSVIAPRIRIEFDSKLPAGANGCLAGEDIIMIDQSRDDTENFGGYEDTDIDFYEDVEEGQINGKTALKFRGLDIPQGATITEAHISFVSRSLRSSPATSVISVLDTSSPGEANSIVHLTSGFSANKIAWSIPNWSKDETYSTPSLRSLVQTIVNRADWTEGGDIAFRIDATSGDRRAYSYDGNSGKTPKLYVKYSGNYTEGTLTMREELRSAVQELPVGGGTPIAGLIAEAAQYFTGGKVSYGKSRWGNANNRPSHQFSFDASGSLDTPSGCTKDNPNSSSCSDEKITGNPKYISPINEACQTTHLVYLTDGEATEHHFLTETIYRDLSGGSCNQGTEETGYTIGGEDCAIKLAGYMNTNDLSPLPGDQKVTTHMIGFGRGADPQLMQDMATAGGGGHYAAVDKDELVEALTQIIASISNVNTSFVTSGVTTNQYNRLTHNDELYYSLFSPQSGSVWPGNVKRYRLDQGFVVDVNGNAAVDSLTGEFLDSSRSWWSDDSDGNDVKAGGAAGELGVARTIYSNLSATQKDLTHLDNRFNETNLTATMLNALNDVDRKTIIHWALGFDVAHANYNANDSNSLSNTPAHKKFGDPLHSQPTVLTYNSSNPNKNKSIIYVGTNHGYLHAIDSDEMSGKEIWAFIPKEFLEILTSIQKQTAGPHKYGLDGSISIHLEDLNDNGAVDVDDGEKAYLYVGMRRGGSAYYALDISDPTSPRMLFKISRNSPNFGNLGQTWSRPTVGKINLPGVNQDKLVIMFGGGYDTAQDIEDTIANADSVGNRIYIADAYTGAHLWDSSLITAVEGVSGPVSSMNSVPSELTAFDFDGDSFIDHVYAADTKAQIFRFDIDNRNQIIKGGRIAALQSATDTANNRRFYYSPDAALIRLPGESFIAVSIGSGYRAHPLNETVSDHFYMIKDYGVLNDEFDMDVSLNSLTNITNLVGDANNNGTSDALEAINDETNPSKGWYLTFQDSGEKVIERSITFNNAVIFTTYIPGISGGCQPVSGTGRVYALQVVDGNPYIDTNYDGRLDTNDRSFDLTSSGIAPQPQVIYTDEFRLCVGRACTGGLLPDLLPPIPKGLTGIRWRKN